MNKYNETIAQSWADMADKQDAALLVACMMNNDQQVAVTWQQKLTKNNVIDILEKALFNLKFGGEVHFHNPIKPND